MDSEGAGETVDDPSSEEERATTESESEVDKEADEEETPWRNHSARQSHRQWMILRKWKSKVLRTSWPP